MSIHEAAVFYGVSDQTIRRRLKAGELQGFQQRNEKNLPEWRIYKEAVSNLPTPSPEPDEQVTQPEEPPAQRLPTAPPAQSITTFPPSRVSPLRIEELRAELARANERIKILEEENQKLKRQRPGFLHWLWTKYIG